MSVSLAGAARPVAHGGTSMRVHVHNESWSLVDVTVLMDGKAHELGRVHPDSYPFFELDLREGVEAEVVLVAASDRDGEFRTDTILSAAGDVLLVHLARDQRQSRWWVR